MLGRSALHYAKFILGLEGPQTQTTPAEREALASCLRGAKRIVEIGVFEGFTTRMLADNADFDAVVYGIDPFFSGRLGVCWGELIARTYNSKHIKCGKVHFVPKLSTEVDYDVPTPVDFVFVDGDHSLQGIKADWDYWSERLATGGIIALHDTLPTREKPLGYTLGSIEYFRNHICHDPRFEIIKQQDSTSILRKR